MRTLAAGARHAVRHRLAGRAAGARGAGRRRRQRLHPAAVDDGTARAARAPRRGFGRDDREAAGERQARDRALAASTTTSSSTTICSRRTRACRRSSPPSARAARAWRKGSRRSSPSCYCRVFHRMLTRRARLYTEMVTAGAVLHGDRASGCSGFDACEHPVALQLGGSEPARLARSGADRRRFRLRRDQPQRRLPLRPGAERPLRRLPDARAGAGRRLRGRDDGGGRRSRSPSSAASASTSRNRARRLFALVERGRGAGRDARDRPCAQGLARRAQPQGKPRRSAARLSAGLRLKRALPDLPDRDQRRHRRSRRGARRSSPMSTASCSAAPPIRTRNCCSASTRACSASRRRTPTPSRRWRPTALYRARSSQEGARLHDMTRHMLGLFAGRPGARPTAAGSPRRRRRDAGLDTLRAAVAASARAARRSRNERGGSDLEGAHTAPSTSWKPSFSDRAEPVKDLRPLRGGPKGRP